MSNDSPLLEGAFSVIQNAIENYNGELRLVLTSSQVNRLQEFAYETQRDAVATGRPTNDKQLMNQLCIFVARQAVSQRYVKAGQKMVEELLKLDSLDKAVDFLKYVSWLYDIVTEFMRILDQQGKRQFLESIRTTNLEGFLRQLTTLKISENRFR